MCISVYVGEYIHNKITKSFHANYLKIRGGHNFSRGPKTHADTNVRSECAFDNSQSVPRDLIRRSIWGAVYIRNVHTSNSFD